MNDLYDLAVVGAGLSALRTGIASERIVVLDFQDAPGGFLKAALPAPGFEESWALIRSFRIPREVTTFTHWLKGSGIITEAYGTIQP